MDLQQSRAEQSLSELNWRPMTPDDLNGVVAVARHSFPDHFEGYECFEERQRLAPDSCYVLSGPDGEVKGYLVAYPFKRASAPPLNSLIHQLPDPAEVIYLHDLALHPDIRGGGHTRAVVERLATWAREQNWPEITLVAVNSAAGFWARMGFEPQMPEGMAEKLATYGDDACYMVRPL